MRTDSYSRIKSAGVLLVALLLIAGLTATSFAMPPHPDIRAKIAASKVAEAQYMDDLRRIRAMGVDAPDDPPIHFGTAKPIAGSPQAPTPFKILVLLVDFSDNVASVAASDFDDLVFGTSGNTVRTFYDEVSNSQIDLMTVDAPSSTGWDRAPQW